MKNYNLKNYTLVITISILLLSILGCANKETDKIPITTASDEALNYYLQGRDLSEKLQAQESIQYYQKAITTDTTFAMAYLNLSFVAPSAKEFFENFNQAVALLDKVTEGEKLWILGVQAGVNAFPIKQREYFKKLVAAYPKDERAHNLLGGNYFGQQEYNLAIEEYNKATDIAPDFSQPYNQLGYAYRFLEKYEEAEKAFKKYIELIPDDPNPYDSYAELLMKIGDYNKSIEYYQKALSINPNFVASHIGIATNFNYLEDHEGARKQLKKLYGMARNDGERRAAYFATAVSYVDEGNMGKAIEEINKQYESNEVILDAAAMSGNLVTVGNILLEMGRYNEAMEKYEKAIKLVEESDLSEEVKDNNRRGNLFNVARVALKKGDFILAKAKFEEFNKQVEALNNPNQVRLSHQLSGMIALVEKSYDKAIDELQNANQQNPYNLYRLAQAYQGKGNHEKAKELAMKTVHFNGLNNLNFSFIRNKAKNLLAGL